MKKVSFLAIIELTFMRGLKWNLTKSIRKRRLSRVLSRLRFDILTLLNLSNFTNSDWFWLESVNLIKRWIRNVLESFWLVVSLISKNLKCQNIGGIPDRVTIASFEWILSNFNIDPCFNLKFLRMEKRNEKLVASESDRSRIQSKR